MVRRALAVARFATLWLLAVGTTKAQQPDQGSRAVGAQKLKDHLHVLTVGVTDKQEHIIRSPFKNETGGSKWNPPTCQIPSPLVSR